MDNISSVITTCIKNDVSCKIGRSFKLSTNVWFVLRVFEVGDFLLEVIEYIVDFE